MIVLFSCSLPPPPPPLPELQAIDSLLAADPPSGDALEAATRTLHERLGNTPCGRDALMFGASVGAEGEIGTGPGPATFTRWREDWRAWKARCPRG